MLSPFTAQDVERVHELCQDPEIQRWTTVPSPYLREAAEEFVGKYAAAAWRQLDDGSFTTALGGPELIWGVRVGDGSPLTGLWGSLGLRPHGFGEVEIGWWLGAGVRGQGVMRAAVARLLEVAFAPDGPLRATAVRWYAFVGNLPSVAIAQRTGFDYTGIVERLDRPHWSAVLDAGDPIAPRGDWPPLTAD
ncbi:MAG: GNAT family N-acetyltransferase [Propionicimonas sp.]